MNSIERRQEILKRLQTNGMVSIQSLADELQVSSMTTARDINRFADQGGSAGIWWSFAQQQYFIRT